MTDSDCTLTSPLHSALRQQPPLLALTVLWHPDLSRVGEQVFEPDPQGVMELSRFLPLFSRPGREGLALGHQGVSRLPLRLTRSTSGKVCLEPPASRMAVEVNGVDIDAPVVLEPAQLAAGVVLGLGRAILLCLHWSDSLPRDNPVPGMLGVGSGAARVRELVRNAAATSLPVLLLGETGTGKEVAARAVHALGARAAAPLVAVNMAVMNDALAAAELFGAAKGAYTGAEHARNGLFGEADGATLFLDEIGNTPATVQPMLLRVLESGHYRSVGGAVERHSSARVIAATDQDLSGQDFNQALLRRLESFVIEIPPLRARREDIGVLIVHFLDKARRAGEQRAALPFAFASACANYAWPGNVRQLAQVLTQAVLLAAAGEVPVFEALVRARPGTPAAPEASAATASKRRSLAGVGDDAVLAALHNNGWQIRGAAGELGISRPSMYKLIGAHPDIRRPETIEADEMGRALAAGDGDLVRCAALLQTPLEGLRRQLRVLGLAS
jgi:two-component system nitrogen regulation response regulator GlnG